MEHLSLQLKQEDNYQQTPGVLVSTLQTNPIGWLL
jgi:hypothetical protein